MSRPDWNERESLLKALDGHPLFTGLSVTRLLEMTADAVLERFEVGSLRMAAELPSASYLILRGRVERIEGERAVDVLEQGDHFSIPAFCGRVLEDLVCWRLPPQAMGLLESASHPFLPGHPGDELTEVASLSLGPWLEVEGSATVAELARGMSEIHASGAIVREGTRLGVVTDRDIRAKLVANDRRGSDRVSDIASFPARTVDIRTPLITAREMMLDRGIHHLPVLAGDRVVGLLTDLDLLEASNRDSTSLRRLIETAEDITDLTAAGRRIPATVGLLVAEGVDVERVGLLTSILTDALTKRLLDLAESAVAPLPGRFAWVALGSWGRREQGLVFDQDHAIVYAESTREGVDLLLDIARFVEDGLHASGIPKCPSKVMASSDGWHGNEQEWDDRFAEWIAIPEWKATFLVATALDGRRVAGDLDLTGIHARAVNGARHSPLFLNGLARLAIDIKVPLGFLGDLVTSDEGEHEGLDLKHRGLLPLTLVARRHGLSAGVGSATTTERLRMAAAAGAIDGEQAAGLIESYRLFRELMVGHHHSQIDAGLPTTDEIDPARLGPIQRRSLRDAFRILRRAQRELLAYMQPTRWR